MRISGGLSVRREGAVPLLGWQTPAVLSGGEMIIVAMALLALAVIGISALMGVLARVTRGRVGRRPRRPRTVLRRRRSG